MKNKFSLHDEIVSWIKIILTAAVIAYMLNNFVIANSRVPVSYTHLDVYKRQLLSRQNNRFLQARPHGGHSVPSHLLKGN